MRIGSASVSAHSKHMTDNVLSPQSADKTLDVQGLSCPLPILRAKKALAGMQGGQVLMVLATDPGAWNDFKYFCDNTGHALLDRQRDDAGLRFWIRVR